MTGVIATHHFAPTPTAKANLLAEGKKPESIVVTGNTVIDAFLWVNARLQPGDAPEVTTARMLFVEAHRRGIEQVRNQLVMLIVLNLIITVSIPGISIGGHIGGLIGGGLATVAFRQGDRMRSPAIGYAACLALAVIAVVASIVVANNTSLM